MSGLTIATIIANTAMGLVYVAYGMVTLKDVRRDRGSRGSSHLAYGFAAIMFTCGPHHLDHAAHLAMGNGPGTVLDLLTVSIGLPVGLTWFLLRIEALRGGRGDRTIRSDMAVDVYRTIWAGAFVLILATVFTTQVAAPGFAAQAFTLNLLPNITLAVLYLAIGVVLLRTQLRRHAMDGTWSLSGLSLTAVFPSCAGMHAMLVSAISSGAYAPDGHLLWIDALSIPGTVYFLVVIWLVSEGKLRDNTEAGGDVVRPEAPADEPVPAHLHEADDEREHAPA